MARKRTSEPANPSATRSSSSLNASNARVSSWSVIFLFPHTDVAWYGLEELEASAVLSSQKLVARGGTEGSSSKDCDPLSLDMRAARGEGEEEGASQPRQANVAMYTYATSAYLVVWRSNFCLQATPELLPRFSRVASWELFIATCAHEVLACLGTIWSRTNINRMA